MLFDDVDVVVTIERPLDGVLMDCEPLPLTLSFDHAVADGAPAARFAATLRRLFETADALDNTGATDHDVVTH